jgi:hypothetical protein
MDLKQQRDPTASLCQWLTKHGRQVQSISLWTNGYYYGRPVVTVQLPFQRLQQLRSLSLVRMRSPGCDIQLQCWPTQPCTSSNTAGSDATANSNTGSKEQHQPSNPLEYVASTLTSLTLHNVSFGRSPGCWRCLAALTALQRLKVDLRDSPTSSVNIFGAVLPRLTTITRLCLHSKEIDKLRQAIVQLPQLRELELRDNSSYNSVQGPRPSQQLPLPCSLTRLQVHGPQVISRLPTPSMRHLQLDKIKRMDPTLIPGMLQLTHLQLRMKCGDYSDHSMAQRASGLRNLWQLQHLQLELVDSSSYSRHSMPAVKRQQCSALTASRQLTSLQLSGVQLPDHCGS